MIQSSTTKIVQKIFYCQSKNWFFNHPRMVISSSKSSDLVRNNGDVSNENGDGYLEACLQKILDEKS